MFSRSLLLLFSLNMLKEYEMYKLRKVRYGDAHQTVK